MSFDEEGAGPESAGVDHINHHGKVEFEGVLNCTWCKDKGRILRATRAFKEGEIILAEHPLHIVQEEEKCAAFKLLKKLCKEREDDFDYEPLWYWCAIKSLTDAELKGGKADAGKGATPEVQHNLLLLHHDEVDEPSTAASVIVQEIVPNANPMVVEKLIQIWVLNCFEYSDKPQGYSTYFYSSFMSHSCWPNAVWHYTGTDHVLRCRRDVVIGDEVCISYLPENGLLQAAPNRRQELHETKRFWCDCDRCRSGLEDLSRGLVCPKTSCGKGVVFASTPNGPGSKENQLNAAHFIGSKCSACGEAISKNEATKLAAVEKKGQDMVNKYTEAVQDPTVKAMETDEKFFDEYFRQHVLQDLFHEQLAASYVNKKRFQDQRRLLERRCKFNQESYPGLSGSHAWTLEALGDCHRNMTTTAKSLTSAKECYGEALKVLRLMFGEDHEYVTDVEAKDAEVDLSLKEFS